METRTNTRITRHVLLVPADHGGRTQMSLLPAELRNTYDSAKAAAEIDKALIAARKRIARRRTLRIAASTLAVPIALSATWIGLARFTLLDIPQWPALLFMIAWLVALLVVSRTAHVSTGQSARFLDRALRLDERVGTLYELARATPVRTLSPATSRVPDGLLEDTAFQVKANRSLMPNSWRYRMEQWQALAIGLALVALVVAILLPTSLDQVRAERAALRQTVNSELNKIEQLKAELVTRPGLEDGDRQAIVGELDTLEQSLSNPDLDRSGLLASLADAQQDLQQLSPNSAADFNNLLASARSMQLATSGASRSAPVGSEADWGWDPTNYPDLSDFGKAASAAQSLSERVNSLSSNQSRIAVPLIERASTQAASDDGDLGQSLLDASRAIQAKDFEKAGTALNQAKDRYLDADRRWQMTQSVDKIMATLDEGRQTLAQAGTQADKKGQVGFRRPGANQNGQGSTAGSGTPTEDAQSGNQAGGDQHGLSLNAPSALGANMGSNSPDYSSSKNNSPGNTTGGQAGNQQSTQAGSGQGTQPGTSGGAGSSQPGGGSSGSDNGTPGTFTGQISGPMGGGSGAISQVPNPEGQGISTGTASTQNGSAQSDSIYIPPTEEPLATSSSDTGLPGQASPEQNPNGIQGRGGDGGDGAQTPSDTGAGARNQIRTPYKEVIGSYAEQATQALERTYIPSDAREYVKNYFSQLGK